MRFGFWLPAQKQLRNHSCKAREAPCGKAQLLSGPFVPSVKSLATQLSFIAEQRPVGDVSASVGWACR